jgi:hypothetical protein
MALADGSFCSFVCEEGGCPSRYSCQELEDNGQFLSLCLPDSGTCNCTVSSAGQIRPCSHENSFGLCIGVETCDPDLGFVDCSASSPEAELCDGKDNDCNGLIDDGLPSSMACEKTAEGVGTCYGQAICLGSAGWVCDARDPQPEFCDFQDNNCDGTIDEPFRTGGKYTDLHHCGTCNQNCEGLLSNATERCDASRPTPLCVVDYCDGGYYQLNDFQCLPESQTTCRPCINDLVCEGGKCVSFSFGQHCVPFCTSDDDCPEFFSCPALPASEGTWCVPDNDTCDCSALNAGQARPCSTTNSIGTCTGLEFCDPATGWSSCSASQAELELCDGKDNDCNGLPDDGLPAAQPCSITNEFGTCQGMESCMGSLGWVCNSLTPAQELCDYQDNNCNGQVDEGYVINGKYTTLHHCGSCNRDCEGSLPNAVAFCDAVPSLPVCKVQECLPGFYKLNDFQCIMPPDVHCYPCTQDSDCYFSRCVPLDGGKYCLPPCTNGECGTGSQCETIAALGVDICLPETRSCECTAEQAGKTRSCSVTNAHGTCFGVEICLAESGWASCNAMTPSQEVCDGKDNNCNGVIDEGFEILGSCLVTNEHGACPGTEKCVGALGILCQGPVPAPEICDYQDNNCDGGIDEDFTDEDGRYVHLNYCGSCNRNCEGALPNAETFCDVSGTLPVCKVAACLPGYFPLNEYQCILPPDTTCQSCTADADCYFDRCLPLDGSLVCLKACGNGGSCPAGKACQTVPGQGSFCVPVSGSCACSAANEGAFRSCQVTNSRGTCYGKEVCHAATGWSPCDAAVPAQESCDGVDNNCNGLVDEGFDAPGLCENTNAHGSCQGILVCKGTLGLVCEGSIPAPETCDYMDNNCNSTVDEGFINAEGKYHTLRHCGSCNRNCEGALPNATAYCDASSSLPVCKVASCNQGYFQLNDYQCITPPETRCKPCNSDDECYFNICAPLDGAKYCLTPCSGSVCSAGSSCTPVSGYGNLCVPDTGTCNCGPTTHGTVRSCANTNQHGTCYGVETCDGSTGWSLCDARVPAQETCDGVDNNCNGLIDEGFSNLGQCQVTNTFGTCTGAYVCLGPAGLICQGQEPAEEICDYLDNNCSGSVDESFKNPQGRYHLLDHCGACNRSCTNAVANGTAYCDSSTVTPACKVLNCDPGFFPLNEYQCIQPPDSTCQICASDADCYFDRCVPFDMGRFCLAPCSAGTCPGDRVCTAIPGQGSYCVPKTGSCSCNTGNHGAVRSCSKSNAFGTCYGFQTCSVGVGWSACDARTSQPESCDGVDNDCNGLVDEGFDNLGLCQNTNVFGTCEGAWFCMGASGLFCQGPIPALDICDYQDNNCNSQVDEDYRNTDGKYYTLHHCGSCNRSCEGALANATEYCDFSLTVPDCKVQQCDEGFFQLNDYHCILPPPTACKPCESDADCYFDQCVLLDGARYCLSVCHEGDCPDGFTCQNLTGEGPICVPSTLSCDCTPANHGNQRTCQIGNTHGTCYGVQTCDSVAGWGACSAKTPAAESCNGQDDNCNGQVDEGFVNLGSCVITNGHGTCTGTQVCMGEAGIVCQGQTPSAEVCDYLDNDCDTQVDEDFTNAQGKYNGDLHCGSCNNPCATAIPNATGLCDASYSIPRCVVSACDAGYYQISPFQCVLPPDSTCIACTSSAECFGHPCVMVDGTRRCAKPCSTDADCENTDHQCISTGGQTLCQPISGSCDCHSGTVGIKRTCSKSNAIGTCFGFETCNGNSGWGVCGAAMPAAETCDGVDNDCNGLVDDDLPSTRPCVNTNGHGTCEGAETCLGTAGWICQAPTPGPEVCDYVDNNCNGSIDETFKTGDKYTHFNHCGSCSTSCASGFPNATAKCDETRDTPVCVVDTCESGYFKLNDFQCIPDSASLCEPCVTDDNCVLQGARCVTLSDGKFCSKSCSSSADCPAGYACQVYAGGTKQCIPSSNSCLCSAANVGMTKSCEATWPPTPAPGESYITCYGSQVCQLAGWTGCQLDAEVCDGQDNDCNGMVDDGFLVAGKYVQEAHCGQCGNNCTFLTFPNGHGYCDISLSVPVCAMGCAPGYHDVNHNPADGCECQWLSSDDWPNGVDRNCDGVDGDISNAIFVAKNGSDAYPGTITQPMLTLQAAMNRAGSTGKRDVYVSTGVYTESIQLVAGVRTYGGFSPNFLLRNIELNATVIMGQAFTAAKPGSVNAVGIAGAAGSTVLDGFTIYGRNNMTAGGSSYAAYVRNSTNALVLTNNTLEAGSGGPGSKGTNGDAGANGVDGNPGAQAYRVGNKNCSNLPRTGASGGATTCGGNPVNGGKGGDNHCPSNFDSGPAAGENGVIGQGPSGGAGGSGGWTGQVWVFCAECRAFGSTGFRTGLDGKPGVTGTNGLTAGGNACSVTQAGGYVSAGLWYPNPGVSGVAGGRGSGGGGGGAGGGAMGDWTCGETHVGGSGGGGGSGACGGTGGGGASGGGGSFALFITWDSAPASVPSISGNLLYGSVGGSGGVGGNGGSGGTSGRGGTGGAENPSTAKCAGAGGTGGIGGHGGHGEGGGGGCGGASYCIFAQGNGAVSLNAYKTGNTFVPGSGGSGGSGGPSIGNSGGLGGVGASGATNF